MLLALTLASLAPQTTWYVDASAAAPGSGTPASPYNRVDYALAQPTTLSGDTVLVAPGDYVDERISFLGKDVVVRSTGGAATTTLRGEDDAAVLTSTVLFENGETGNAVLDGFTIVGARGVLRTLPNQSFGEIVGCGVVCDGASPTLQNLVFRPGPVAADVGTGAYLEGSSATFDSCVFDDLGDPASATSGAGIAAIQSSVLLTDTFFTNCDVGVFGGGVFARNSTVQATRCVFQDSRSFTALGTGIAAIDCDLLIDDCDFRDNRGGGQGGAVYATGGTLDVRGSSFVANDSGFDAYEGGALYCNTDGATIRDSEFRANQGSFGGGAFVMGSGTFVEDCSFIANRAFGAQQYGCGGGGLFGGSVVRRCVFVDNIADDTFSDGGGAIFSSALIERCTFVGNAAVPGKPDTVATAGTLVNCIVRGSSANHLGGTNPTNSATVRYSNIEGGYPGTGNIDFDPLFWVAWPDLGLLPGSPCIDAGDPNSALDPDGTRADMGAIPFDPFRCEAGCAGPVGVNTCVARTNSTGRAASLVAFGSEAVANDRFVLTAFDVPSQQFGFFLASRAAGFGPLAGGSQGVLCIGGSVLRLDQSILTDRGTGAVSLRPDLSNLAQGQPVLGGETWHFQYWFRDLNPTQTSNTSAALRVTFQ